MLSTENNVRIKTLSLQRSIIIRGWDNEALPRNGRAFFLCPAVLLESTRVRYIGVSPLDFVEMRSRPFTYED